MCSAYSGAAAVQASSEEVVVARDGLHANRHWFSPHLVAVPKAGVVLELGCGPGEDAQALTSLGFDVVATDLLPRQLARARERLGTGSLLRIDHRFPLPFREHSFDLVLASLSLHYFPWGVTLAVFDEIHRVLKPGARLLFRVNATDDLHYGASDGVEVERHLRATENAYTGDDLKRFFDEQDIRRALSNGFVVESLRHATIVRWEHPKQAWECLARARVAPVG